MADLVGQQLGNYRLISLLGEGGFDQVYLGEHLYLKSQVAIKVFHTQFVRGDIEDFRSEARSIANLKHPNIVRVLEFGVERNVPYLVMDYASSGTLRERYPKGNRLSLDTAMNYTKQVAAALQYAHERKLVHRDVKPENMLLDVNNQVVLSDFAITLETQSSLTQGVMGGEGTIAYMAPEQIQGHPGPASDQYSLGVVVYEWLSGNSPFNGTLIEVASKHLFVPPPPLREKYPDIPPDVEQVVLTALAKNPQERFATVQAFATALEQAMLRTRNVPQKAVNPSLMGTSQFVGTDLPVPSATTGTGNLGNSYTKW